MEAISNHVSLIHAAKEAGIDVPPDIHSFVREEFPFWVLFCECQLDRPLLNDRSHYKNAVTIAASKKGLKYGDVQDLLE